TGETGVFRSGEFALDEWRLLHGAATGIVGLVLSVDFIEIFLTHGFLLASRCSHELVRIFTDFLQITHADNSLRSYARMVEICTDHGV
ncbi:MAG: hypothetical protein K2F70_08040, partial [Muribaculaceae bacterium]|nr:hypothetical protein [Muribaculaceae bacterium]